MISCHLITIRWNFQSFNPTVTVKHLIESLGVPHTEVDLILVNGEPAGFDYQVNDGDRISVYPVFEALNITSLDHPHPQPLRDPRFVLDVHLGRLAAYLRMRDITLPQRLYRSTPGVFRSVKAAYC